MGILVPIGTIITLAGLGVLIWCIIKVMGARKSAQTPEELTETLRKLAPVNMAALFLSAIGLIDARQDLDDCRFARAVLAHKGCHLSRV